MSGWGQRSVPRHVRKRIHERDGYRCRLGLPGCTVASEAVHHIVPGATMHSREDNDNDDQLLAVCNHCHHIVTEQHRIARVKEVAAQRSDRRKLPQYRRGAKHPGDP